MLKTFIPIGEQELSDASAVAGAFGFLAIDFDFRCCRIRTARNIEPSRYVTVSIADIYERHYCADRRSWVVQFEDDLINGAFGAPEHLRLIMKAQADSSCHEFGKEIESTHGSKIKEFVRRPHVCAPRPTLNAD